MPDGNGGIDVIYAILSRDRTQAVYSVGLSNQVVIRDMNHDDTGYSLFRTSDRELAQEIWESTGGTYGDFEICEV